MLAVHPNGIGCIIYKLSDGEPMKHVFRFPALPTALARFKNITEGDPWEVHFRQLPRSVFTKYPQLKYYVFRTQHSPWDLLGFHPGVENMIQASLILGANRQLGSMVLPERELLQPKPLMPLGRGR